MPPWDTWIAYLQRDQDCILVSWVPNEMVDLVNSGIEVCPEQCFNWLGFRAKELEIALKQKGLNFK